MGLLHLCNEPLPEHGWLGVRVVHPERGHSLVDPEEHDALQFLPEIAPVGALEIDRIDILIFLRRVLRVLDRPVGSHVEPVGMVLHPGVVRRALDSEVQGDVHPQPTSRLNEGAEVVQRPEG